MKKCIAIGAVIAGICIMLFPHAREFLEAREQREILQVWQQEMAAIGREEEAATQEPVTEQETGQKTEPVEEREETSDTGAGMEQNAEDKEKAKGESVVGVLRIPAIDLEQPVLKGATKQNLSISLATVEPTGMPGAVGNFAVAGHNSRTYGRHFNRLQELEKGDELFVDTGTESYTYEVIDSYVVEAEEVWVLGDTIDGAEITLITCYYPQEGKTQRLIVKGILQEQ